MKDQIPNSPKIVDHYQLTLTEAFDLHSFTNTELRHLQNKV